MVDVELQLSLVLRKRRAHFDGIWVRYRLERAQRSGQPLDLRARMVACLLQCAARRIESSTLAHDALEQRSARGSLVGTRNHVPHGNAALLETKDLLRTREHGLVRRELQSTAPGIFRQLIDDVEIGLVRRHAHAGPDSERVDPRFVDQLRDDVLVEAAAREDLDALESRGVEELATLARELAEIAGVESHGRDFE